MNKIYKKLLVGFCSVLLVVELLTTAWSYSLDVGIAILSFCTIVIMMIGASTYALFKNETKLKIISLAIITAFITGIFLYSDLNNVAEFFMTIFVLAIWFNPALIILLLAISTLIAGIALIFIRKLQASRIQGRETQEKLTTSMGYYMILVSLVAIFFTLIVINVNSNRDESIVNDDSVIEGDNTSTVNSKVDKLENSIDEENGENSETSNSSSSINNITVDSGEERNPSVDLATERQNDIENNIIIEKATEDTEKNAALELVSEQINNDITLRKEFEDTLLYYSPYPDDNMQGFANGLYGESSISSQYKLSEELNPDVRYVATFDLENIPAEDYLSAEELDLIEREQVAYEIGETEMTTVRRPLASYTDLLTAGYGTMYFGQSGDNLIIGSWPEASSDELIITNRVAQNLCSVGKCSQIDELIGKSLSIPFEAYDIDGNKYTTSLTGTISGISLGMETANDIILATN